MESHTFVAIYMPIKDHEVYKGFSMFKAVPTDSISSDDRILFNGSEHSVTRLFTMDDIMTHILSEPSMRARHTLISDLDFIRFAHQMWVEVGRIMMSYKGSVSFDYTSLRCEHRNRFAELTRMNTVDRTAEDSDDGDGTDARVVEVEEVDDDASSTILYPSTPDNGDPPILSSLVPDDVHAPVPRRNAPVCPHGNTYREQFLRMVRSTEEALRLTCAPLVKTSFECRAVLARSVKFNHLRFNVVIKYTGERYPDGLSDDDYYKVKAIGDTLLQHDWIGSYIIRVANRVEILGCRDELTRMAPSLRYPWKILTYEALAAFTDRSQPAGLRRVGQTELEAPRDATSSKPASSTTTRKKRPRTTDPLDDPPLAASGNSGQREATSPPPPPSNSNNMWMEADTTATSLLNLSEEELVAKHLSELYPNASSRDFLNLIADVLRAEKDAKEQRSRVEAARHAVSEAVRRLQEVMAT